MKILVLLKMVPDVVEGLAVAPDGRSLDLELLRLIASERDDHALEQALLLKERHGGTVTASALDAPEVDDALYTALAKGADRAVKITGFDARGSTRPAVALLARTLPTIPDVLPADLVLTGCQAIDDLDGSVAPLLAHELGLPYLGIVTAVDADPAAARAAVVKEFSGGVRGEFDVPFPALLGIQAAEKPPRYVMVGKIQAAMRSREIEEIPAAIGEVPTSAEILRMAKPEVAAHAEMLAGPPEEVSARVFEILAGRGLP